MNIPSTLLRVLVAAAALLPTMIVARAADKDPAYEVAVYYCPVYHADPRNDARLGPGWTEWKLIQEAVPRFPGHAQPKVPLWGYEDESDPTVMARKIDAAADHGVTSFIFDWYWHEDGPFINRALDEGFLEAPNRERLKFGLMWANHDWLDIFPAKKDVEPKLLYRGGVGRRTFDEATDHMIRRYFSQPNYWTIDGRPYLSIYEAWTLIDGLGGMEAAREAIAAFRARAAAAGLPGLHLNAVGWGKLDVAMVKSLGFDSVTSYCWIHHAGVPDHMPYAKWAEESCGKWAALEKTWPVPFFPNVTMGWDNTPRFAWGKTVTGNTPAEFRKALERARRFMDARKSGQKVVTINAWNEWTEGSSLEPDTVNRMGYLEAIKAVFPPRE